MKKSRITAAYSEVDRMRLSEVELVYRSKVKASQRPCVKTSHGAYEVLKRNWDPNKIELVEQCKVLLLNQANKVLAICELSTGGLTGTSADPKVIFMAALQTAACAMILAHNHPSGNLLPSRADIDLTRKVKEGGNLLDITVLDHLIISPEGYYSFADEGLL